MMLCAGLYNVEHILCVGLIRVGTCMMLCAGLFNVEQILCVGLVHFEHV
jgi:hypothetical protein